MINEIYFRILFKNLTCSNKRPNDGPDRIYNQSLIEAESILITFTHKNNNMI